MRSTTTSRGRNARLDQAHVRTDGGVAERLVELVGEDAFALQAEIEKLADWAGDETVGVEEVGAARRPVERHARLGTHGRLGRS